MSQVSVSINGRQYRMACDDGEESHLMRLAKDLDSRIDQLRGSFGEIGDTRLIVMAALTLADDMVEMGNRIKRLEDDLAALQDARALSAERAQKTQDAIAAALNAAAGRVEGVTKRLNQSLGDGVGIG